MKNFKTLCNLRLLDINSEGKSRELIRLLEEFGFEWQGEELVLPENPFNIEGRIKFDFKKKIVKLDLIRQDGSKDDYCYFFAEDSAKGIFEKFVVHIKYFIEDAL